ncbi:hypothetical protein MIND_01273700 [Mycena indigotica]|uniref:Uncharacterized protein n=1 Tax=Mycena indigotica TaxID=2126181 RepID=A0A8H6S3R5_9AGAR|nr:uncharacterized protein MIND_01273700 [Mycena indigotica]KAF7291297.1 hypothetical protein MIND_01273700 [Mycena indigotica]
MPRNYDYENATLKDLPKHWDAATNRVVSWLPALSLPYPLENLLGRYTLVAARNQPKSLCENSTGSLGSLTLDLYAGDRLSWENISGSFSLANSALAASGRFLGLRTPEVSPFDRASFSATGIARPTLRSFELTTS